MALTARIILGALCQALQEPPPKRVDRRYDQTSAWIRPPRRAPFKERMPGRQCHKEPPHSGFGLNGKPSNEQGVAWRISLSTGAPWYFRRGVLSRGGLRIILTFIYL